MPSAPTPTASDQDIIDRARGLAQRFAERAPAAEEGRRIPSESIKDMIDAGFARTLLPKRAGGYGLGFDAWFDVMRELSKADASHGWCAGLIVHHNHIIGQFPEAAQKAVWAEGPDIAIAASFAPAAKAVAVDGGYRLTAKGSPFASGVDHSSWVILGGIVEGDSPDSSNWQYFLVKPGDYTIQDTWFTAAMRGTGSKTIVVENAFVPASHVLRLVDLRDGKGPGGALHPETIYHTPFFYYAPITFVTPMIGAVQGAFALFREWTKTRRAPDGSLLGEKPAIQVRMARAAADIDAAELLLRRALRVIDTPHDYAPILLARSIRDFTRAGEYCVEAIDTIVALSGTACFASSHPIQRAWRDIHFMAMHISLNPEMNFANFGRMAFGFGRDPSRPYY
jgi:3-hydroxy-9,10-secoandrosta-1,3,5(10)-triene-9,17-dione monooxygenase